MPSAREGGNEMTGWEVLEQAGELARRGEPFALATVVWRQGPSSSQQGARAIITAGGELHGWIGGACAEPAVVRAAQEVIAEGTPRLLLLGTPGQFGAAIPSGITVVPISCQSEGALEVYIEPVVPAPHLVIVGGSPMAHTLAGLARALDWRVKLVAGQDFTAADADDRSMVIVATQGHGDEEAVEQAVAARPAYLGLVGSRRRGAAVLGYLADRGLPGDQLDRVHVPAGLDLGHTTHQEIAVAILAELVQLRASGALAGAGAKRGGGESRAGAVPAAPADAAADAGAADAVGPVSGATGPASGVTVTADTTDPVCGMTVPATAASRPLTHDGVTYYFCGTGCRRAFEKDPAAYVKRETRC
jgi:xanthine dehydrogenase accessory factor